MIKKIGELTLREANEILNHCKNYKSCKECEEKDLACYKLCDLKENLFPNLDEEVEVNENESKIN